MSRGIRVALARFIGPRSFLPIFSTVTPRRVDPRRVAPPPREVPFPREPSPRSGRSFQRGPSRRRRSSLRGGLAGALLAASALLQAAPAGAFCRTRTCEFDSALDCEEDRRTGCSTVGVEARWGDGCLSFAIQEDGSIAEGISSGELGSLVQDAFRVWSDADCGGGETPPLTAVDRGDIECRAVEYNCEEGDANNNIIVFEDGPNELPSRTIALSTIIANLRTGEILDVDIQLNSYRFSFDPRDPQGTDLAIVVNHEVGHLLGLSHSNEVGSLMQVEYDAGPLLGSDDEAGICAAYGASDADPVCSDIEPLGPDAACVGSFTGCRVPAPSRGGGGCSVAALGGGSPGGPASWWAALAAFGLALRGRRWIRRR